MRISTDLKSLLKTARETELRVKKWSKPQRDAFMKATRNWGKLNRDQNGQADQGVKGAELMKYDFKYVLKKLAEKLPAEYMAYYDDENDFLYLEGEHLHLSGPVLNAPGTTVLKQYIESEGYAWMVVTLYDDNKNITGYRCVANSLHYESRNYAGEGAKEWQAVAKAALEVARRMK